MVVYGDRSDRQRVTRCLALVRARATPRRRPLRAKSAGGRRKWKVCKRKTKWIITFSRFFRERAFSSAFGPCYLKSALPAHARLIRQASRSHPCRCPHTVTATPADPPTLLRVAMTAFVVAPSGLFAGPPALLRRPARLGGGAPRRAPAVATAHPPSVAAAAGPGGVTADGAAPTTPTTLAGPATVDEGGVAAPAAEQRRRVLLSRRAFLGAATAASTVVAGVSNSRAAAAAAAATGAATFFDLTASRGGAPAPLRNLFDGKVTLVVNVASYCALTPQYEGLVALHRKYAAGGEGKRPFDIAAFPCNQVRLSVGRGHWEGLWDWGERGDGALVAQLLLWVLFGRAG